MTFFTNQEVQTNSDQASSTASDNIAKAARGALSAEGNEAQTSGEKVGSNVGLILSKIENFDPNKAPDILFKEGKRGQIDDALKDLFKKGHEPSEKEREQAKKKLAEGISDLIPKEDACIICSAFRFLTGDTSDLIPEKDRAVLKAMQASLIDGDLKGFQAAVLSLKDNPEKLQVLIKELNQGLDRSEMGQGADVRMDSKGNVLLYEGNGNTAIEINPKTGAVTLQPIEARFDGTVVLQPGEVLGADPDKVMREIGNTVTDSIFPHKYRHGKPPYDPGIIKPGGGKDGWPGPRDGGKIKLTPMNRIDGTLNFYDQ
ncbi:MAG: hypothetical protein K8F91_08825 [Candidatus Obscuribacterales bacterium]|nr:hypothetical protein [Candidatus Obscuribacterales bacterium]